MYKRQSISYIHGKNRVSGVTLSKLDENRNPIKGEDEFIECDTVLLSVGLIPENELSVDAGVNLDMKMCIRDSWRLVLSHLFQTSLIFYL